MGQHAERRQQLQQHVVRQLREAQLHRVDVLRAVLEVGRDAVQVFQCQRDARQVHRVVLRLPHQDGFQAAGEGKQRDINAGGRLCLVASLWAPWLLFGGGRNMRYLGKMFSWG